MGYRGRWPRSLTAFPFGVSLWNCLFDEVLLLATVCNASKCGVAKLVVGTAKAIDESSRARLRPGLSARGAFVETIFGSALAAVVAAEVGALDLINLVACNVA